MELEILEKIYLLKASEPLNSLTKNLVINDALISKNDEIILLASIKDKAIQEYGFNLEKLGKNNEITKKSAVNMAKAIEKLNNHPLVKNYNEALVEYNLLIDRIKKIIFDF